MEFMRGQELGQIMKETRRAKRLTLREVADYANCSPSYVHRIEAGLRPNFNLRIMGKLVELYELDLNILQVHSNPIDSSEDVKNHFNKVESFFSNQEVPELVQAALVVVATALETEK